MLPKLDLNELIKIYLACRKIKDYKPQPVTANSVNKWLNQFRNKDDRDAALSLLLKVKFISERETTKALVDNNEKILHQLKARGILPKNVIYVSLDTAGSSSPVMLNLLRDRGRLERLGCHFIDSKNVFELIEKTTDLAEGALIYVDDFAGTGNQFVRSRNYVASNVPLIGNFSEFLLIPCICDEALVIVKNLGVDVRYSYLHSVPERPLHQNNVNFGEEMRKRLIPYCEAINKEMPLGYENLATMVVFYRNTPNTVPLCLRGNIGQDKFVGVIPRTTDLPSPSVP